MSIQKFIGLLALILVVGFIFMDCQNPIDSQQVLTFEEAVQEIYEMAGATLFYSSNGRTMDRNVNNRAVGPNEIPGVCTDYAIEFAYYWNEVKNYDDLYGKAYLARVPYNSSNLQIQDFRFAPNGTSTIRETSGDFGLNGNDQESDGVYRDVIVTSVVYSGKNILHFGYYIANHKWVVINIGDDWYDCDPTWWDTTWGDGWFKNKFMPYKISF